MRGTGEARARQRTFSERMLVPKHWVESLIDPDDDPPPRLRQAHHQSNLRRQRWRTIFRVNLKQRFDQSHVWIMECG
jgi:hypothetical protein